MSDAKNSRAQARSGAGIWLDQHLYSVVSSLGRAVRRPWATLLTVGVMAVAFALPLGLWLALQNVGHFAGDVQQSREIDLFLTPETPVARAQALAETLRARDDVASVEVRTPDQGLAEFRQRSGLADSLDLLDGNPLPALLVVVPEGDEARLVAALEALPETDLLQHDAAWRERLTGWMGFGERLTWVLAALFGLGALLVVGNTVRLDIGARSEEIAVLQHLGATDAFVRRPFLYLGAWYGLAAGLLAGALLMAAGLLMQGRLSALVASYGTQFALSGPGLRGSLLLLAGSALMGWLGAWLATGHHLRRTRPVDV